MVFRTKDSEIHVLDMASRLPATAIVSMKLRKRKTFAFIFVGPFLNFSVLTLSFP